MHRLLFMFVEPYSTKKAISWVSLSIGSPHTLIQCASIYTYIHTYIYDHTKPSTHIRIYVYIFYLPTARMCMFPQTRTYSTRTTIQHQHREKQHHIQVHSSKKELVTCIHTDSLSSLYEIPIIPSTFNHTILWWIIL